MKKLLIPLLLLLLLCGCTTPDPLARVSEAIGLDVTGGELLTDTDTHGGFHGDGSAVLHIAVPGLKQPDDPHWHDLPMTLNVHAALYGSDTLGPLFPEGSVPEVENGFWFFRDRHTQAANTADDTDLHSRSSWNFTVAVYDADTGTLYYLELDT